MTTKLYNGPKLWTEILSVFPPGSMIAGGAVRDFYQGGGNPKDIDVFYKYTSGPYATDAKYVTILEEKLIGGDYVMGPVVEGWAYDPEYPSDRDRQYEGKEIAFVEDYIYKGFKVNVIGLFCEPMEHMYRFDLGTTRCLYDGNLFYTQEFIQDMLNKTVTLLHSTPEQFGRSKSRAERFIQNNKDFTFIDATDQGTKNPSTLS